MSDIEKLVVGLVAVTIFFFFMSCCCWLPSSSSSTAPKFSAIEEYEVKTRMTNMQRDGEVLSINKQSYTVKVDSRLWDEFTEPTKRARVGFYSKFMEVETGNPKVYVETPSGESLAEYNDVWGVTIKR